MIIKTWLTILLSFVLYLLGGYDMGIETLLIVVALDYVTGILKAIVNRSLNSYIGWRGLVRKTGVFISIIVAVQIECLINAPGTLHNFVAFAFTVNECISILENLIDIGVPVPDFLVKYLKKLKDKDGDNKNG
jgi:toxin secretion/phage lysis holin